MLFREVVESPLVRVLMYTWGLVDDPRRRALLLVLLLLLRRPRVVALGLGALLLAQDLWLEQNDEALSLGRSFFGVYRVRDDDGERVLLRGTTIHGQQRPSPAERATPLGYYHRGGPISDLFTKPPWRRTAVVGLGAGSLAAYAGPGQQVTFYEIDPVVRWIADEAGYFSYLRDARARGAAVGVVLGDARISLRRAPDGAYDLIAVNAFSSDAIPVHLLTREALALYLRKLAPGGLLAMHITNRSLGLEPVVAALVKAAGGAALSRDTTPLRGRLPAGQSAAHRVAIARSAGTLAPLGADDRRRPLTDTGARPGTDDYADLLGALR